jgi:ABC-type transport system involved in multi-copper enzyme maturation permease subunit
VSGVVISETLRRHLTNVAFVAGAIVVAIVAIGVSHFERPGTVWPGLVVLIALVAGSAVIGPEFSSGTLQLILVKPINRAVYLLSRVAGVVLAVWSAALLAAICEYVGRSLREFTPIATSLVNSMADALLVVSLLAFLGSFTRAYFNVAIYFLAQMFLGMLIGLGVRKFPEQLNRALRFAMENLYPDAPPRIDRDWLLLVACNAAIALLLACLIFRKREVPYGAD